MVLWKHIRGGLWDFLETHGIRWVMVPVLKFSVIYPCGDGVLELTVSVVYELVRAKEASIADLLGLSSDSAR